MRCKQHPQYAANRMPRKTVQHPDGCPTCWGVWEAAKTDKKRRARTVNVELTVEEARRAVLALDKLLSLSNRAEPRRPTTARHAASAARQSDEWNIVRNVITTLKPLLVLLARATQEAL